MKKITRYIDQLTNRIIPNGPAQARTRHRDNDQVNLPSSSTVVPSSLFPTHPRSTTVTESRSKGSLTSRVRRRIVKKLTNRRRCTSFAQLFVTAADRLESLDAMYYVGLVDIVHDDILLAIFDYCVSQNDYDDDTEVWQTLVHVCHRWRIIVFESPRRLKLRLVCTHTTPADRLDIWPPLPLYIQCPYRREGSLENVLALFERSNRVYRIDLASFPRLDFEKISAAMEVTFPELTDLLLLSEEKAVRVLPDSFLGGSAPRLRGLSFIGIPFPGLPKLLLSATHLLFLCLEDIPHSGYFSPEAIATALSTLNSLFELRLEFQSPLSRPDRRPPPPTPFAFPTLTEFWFKGATEYLEDLMARISAPGLRRLDITFFNQIIFDTPQFIQFISRTPTFMAPDLALLIFEDGASRVGFSSQTPGYEQFEIKIPCIELDWQVSSMEQVFTSCLPHLSTLEGLFIGTRGDWLPGWQDNVENTLWLELLLPFTTVKNLYISEEFARRIVPALQDLVEDRRTDVLPVVETIFLDGLEASGPIEKGIGQFVAMREVTGHPVAVTRWDRSY